MNAKRIGVTIAALAVLAAGCGRQDGGGSGAGGSGATGARIAHPTGADELVLRVEYQGGFVPDERPGIGCAQRGNYEFTLSTMPAWSLFGDGTLITQGPQIEIYPPPALPSLVRTQITEDGVQAILEAAQEAGLMDGDKDYGDQCIADAATTVFTTNANGTTSVVSAYALDVEPAGSCGSKEQAKARTALAEFQADLGDLMSWLPKGSVGGEKPFDPTEMRVYVLPYRRDAEPPQPAMDWPLETPLSAFGEPLADAPETRCGVITGDEFEQLHAAAQSANQLTPWLNDGTEFRLILRPLLPDEHTC
jgi:hypothetical protein